MWTHNPPTLAVCASMPPILRDLLADAWERWARQCAELTPQNWSTPTRCSRWDVAALVAHVCPDLAMFDMLAAATIEGPPAVTDASKRQPLH